MTRILTFLLIGILCLASYPASVQADALADDVAAIDTHIKALGDEKSEVREAAAAELRRIIAKYPGGTTNIASPDGGETFWKEKAGKVTPGMKKAEVEALLPPSATSPERSTFTRATGGTSRMDLYRLDRDWTVSTVYREGEEVEENPKLTRKSQAVDVKPPANFSGLWTTWYVNGQKYVDAEYKDGQLDGTWTRFHDTGPKSDELHYAAGKTDGSHQKWRPDGTLSFSAQMKAGQFEGTIINYYPDGSKRNEYNYRDGKLDGRSAQWYENGQMKSEVHYKNGAKDGTEAAWDEKGILQYQREYKDGNLIEGQQ